MDPRTLLMNMLRQMLKDMEIVSSMGAGYYTCSPFAQRYNKLLGQARKLFTDHDGIMSTFDEMPESDPKDPADKSKLLQGIRVEVGQLISLLDSSAEDKTR